MGMQKKGLYSLGGLLILSLMLLLLAPGQSHAVTYAVNSTADIAGLTAACSSGTGTCTLRSAIQAANAVGGTITLPAGTYTLTIPGRLEQAAATGDLDLTGAGGPVIISGAGAATTIIDGGAIDRVFEIILGNVTISGVTIRNGNSGGVVGGGILTGGAGVSLALNNVIVTGNTAGLVNVEGAAIDLGGGGATVTMNNVAIVSNNSLGGGNIIAVGAAPTSLTIVNGTLSGNFDSAISNGGNVSLTNVTISGNTAVNGTAIDNKVGGTVNLLNCTIASNIAAPPANIGGIRNAGTVTLLNTIIADNTPVNCSGAFVSQGNNIEKTNTCGLTAGTDKINTDPLLFPLADNGKTTLAQTHAIDLTSPAIDTGSTTTCPTTDARAIALRPRPIDGNTDGVATCDIGAYEFMPQTIVVTPASIDFGTVTGGTSSDKVITIQNIGDGHLAFLDIAGLNPLAAPFSLVANTCVVDIPFFATCTLTARFSPTAVALSTDSFNIQSNDPTVPTPGKIVALSGAGSAALFPNIVVEDSIAPANDQKLPFTALTIGSSADATITLTSTGTATLTIGTITPPAAPFSITSDTCSGTTLPDAAACSLTIHFAPSANSTVNSTISIPNNATASPVVMTLTGSGISTTGNSPPSQPVLVTPAPGQTGVPTTMTFIWNKVSDPDGNTITYHFDNCTDQAMTTGCTNADVTAAVPSGLFFAGLGSLGAGVILIGFINGSGLRRSRMMMLTIALLLLSGAIFMSCHSSSSESTPPPPIAADQVSSTVKSLAPNTVYYWKVVADDGKGGLSSSETQTYTTAAQ